MQIKPTFNKYHPMVDNLPHILYINSMTSQGRSFPFVGVQSNNNGRSKSKIPFANSLFGVAVKTLLSQTHAPECRKFKR